MKASFRFWYVFSAIEILEYDLRLVVLSSGGGILLADELFILVILVSFNSVF